MAVTNRSQPNPNSRESYERIFEKRRRRGWFRKRKYRWLSYLLPGWALRTKLRKSYHPPVAELVEGRFLDLGCGLGACAALYARRSGNPAVGVDFARSGLVYARNECRRLGIEAHYVNADGLALPFGDGCFDSVYIGQVLEHLDDEAAFVQEALRVLVADGLLVISVPKGTACSGTDADHVNFYHTEEDVAKIVEGLPVANIAFHPFHKYRYFLSGRHAGAN